MENSLLTVLHPAHPKLVHFPIALVISAMGVQMLGCLLSKDSPLNRDSLRNGAWLMFVLGALSMPVVVWSGLAQAASVQLDHPVLTAHKQFAFAATWISLGTLPVLWAMRFADARIFHAVFLTVLILVSGLLGLAAHQGGRMVYEYAVGVSR